MRCAIVLIVLSLLGIAPHTAALTWLNDYAQAERTAKLKSQPIFMDFYAEACGWCKKLDQEVYSNPDFIRFMQGYVPLRVNIDDASTRFLVERYKIQTLPTIVILNFDGTAVNRIGGFLNAKDLIADVSMMKALVSRESTNPNDWNAVQLLAEEYLFRDLNAEAEHRFARILAAPIDGKGKESAHFSMALAQYYQGKIREALQTLNGYLKTYADGLFAPDALLLTSQIHLELNAKAEAKSVLQQFLKKFPGNSNVTRAREVLRRL